MLIFSRPVKRENKGRCNQDKHIFKEKGSVHQSIAFNEKKMFVRKWKHKREPLFAFQVFFVYISHKNI